MAKKRQKSKKRKKRPPQKKVQRKMRWWDWVIIISGFIIAFAFLIWAGGRGALTPVLPDVEEAVSPTPLEVNIDLEPVYPSEKTEEKKEVKEE